MPTFFLGIWNSDTCYQVERTEQASLAKDIVGENTSQCCQHSLWVCLTPLRKGPLEAAIHLPPDFVTGISPLADFVLKLLFFCNKSLSSTWLLGDFRVFWNNSINLGMVLATLGTSSTCESCPLPKWTAVMLISERGRSLEEGSLF